MTTTPQSSHEPEKVPGPGPAQGSGPLDRLARTVVARRRWMVAGWLLFVVAMNLLVPQLETVVARDSTPFVPETAPSLRAVKAMDETFGNGRSRSFIVVVAERPGGLRQGDVRYLTTLADRLRQDEDVTYVQDISEPRLRKALTSADGEAMYFQVGLPGYTGAPTAVGQVTQVRDDAEATAPAGLRVEVTGASATITDMVIEVEDNILTITAVTVVLIAIILMIIYRSFAVTAFVLSIIGIALASARAATAFLGLHVLSVSTFTGSFLTGVVLGATTDYVIFLISRYHELRRQGVEPRVAAEVAAARVSAVIIGSAGTVALATASLGLAHVGLFRTTGPPIAVSVLLALGVAVTLAPALIAFFGSRGFLEPRPRGTGNGWARVGALVVAHPGRVLAAGLLPLILLAGFFPLIRVSHDERSVQPARTESNDGYALMDAHFAANEALPDFVLVDAGHDLRDSADLAALEQAAAAVARIPGVTSVRAVTRPTGTTLDAASLGHQARVIGNRLGKARSELADGSQDTARLTSGAGDLHSGAVEVAQGAQDAVAGATRLLGGVQDLHSGLEDLVSGTGDALAGSARLRSAAQALADGLNTAADQTQVAVDGLGMAYRALQQSVTCGIDPVCRQARTGIGRIWVAERDQLLPGLREAAAGAAQLADGTTDLTGGLRRIRNGLGSAESGAADLASGQRDLVGGLDDLAGGSQQVADGSGQVAAGTEQLTGSLADLRGGLAEAADYLRAAGKATNGDAAGGFYLPPSAFSDERFALASGSYLSADGTIARMIVLGGTNPFGKAAADRSDRILETVRTALRGTPLADSGVSITGMAATNADIARLSSSDFRLVAVVALVAVFLVLLLLIRSLVAASILLASVVVSYGATMGLSVLIWQYLLGIQIEWTVPAIAFVLLVAVGADYNLLLIKRVHEEAPNGEAAGISRAVALTGGVITAAGVIFAASLFAMMSGTVDTLVQLGFTTGVGLLIDTFVVRTLVVPAAAALAGRRLWWPARSAEAAA